MGMQIQWHFAHIILANISECDNINPSNGERKQVLSSDESVNWWKIADDTELEGPVCWKY